MTKTPKDVAFEIIQEAKWNLSEDENNPTHIMHEMNASKLYDLISETVKAEREKIQILETALKFYASPNTHFYKTEMAVQTDAGKVHVVDGAKVAREALLAVDRLETK